MDFREQVRNSYQEKPPIDENQLIEERTTELLEKVKKELLEKSKSGDVKVKGTFIKKKFVGNSAKVEYSRYLKRDFLISEIGFSIINNCYYTECRDHRMAKKFVKSIVSRCKAEGIKVYTLDDHLKITVFFTIEL